MPSCVAVNCTNRTGKKSGQTFHRFPHRNPALLKEWLVKMRRDFWTPLSHSTICSDHFEECCFDRTGQTTRLRPDAVPTIFNFPKHLLKSTKQRKAPYPRVNKENCPPEVTESSTPFLSDNTAQGSVPPQQPIDICHQSGSCESTPSQSADISSEEGHGAEDLSSPQRWTPANSSEASNKHPPTPTKRKNNIIHEDHNYSINESPRSVKRKLDKLFDHATNLQKRLKNSQAKSRRLRKKVNTLRDVVATLKGKHLLSESGLEALDKTCDIPGELMKRIVKRRKCDKPSGEKYPPALRAFAITLNFYSAKAYRYVRKTFDLQLPHPSVIRNWYSVVDGQPGFTDEAFRTIAQKVQEAKDAGQELVCGLMLDEMAIKKHVQWDGKKFHGYVDIGAGSGDDSTPLASEALVFMVVALNAPWKLPVGYFLIQSMSGKERANLVEQCLSKLADIGVWISSLTCDGPSCHITMLETLGARMKVPDLQPSFPHPQDATRRVSVFLDICHMIKLMRNTLSAYGILRDSHGNEIRWDYIKELHKIQEEEGLRLGNKIRNAHIQWERQKMKVNLAAQTLSQSVADALEFLKDQGLPQFRGCEATVHFIRTVDRLFDILNSRTPFALGFKAPLRPENVHVWQPFLAETYSYLQSITSNEGTKMYATNRKTPFLGFLAGIRSAEFMYNNLVACTSPPLKYLLTYKMSQDHIELFFCAVRSCLGCNNNPTARQFTSAYKKLLIRHEIQGIGGNCTAQDQTIILHVSSSITRPSSDNDSENDILLLRKYDLSERTPLASDHDYCDTPNLSKLSPFKEAAISYIGGFVVRMARKQVKCEDCVTALTTGEVIDGSLLEKKNRGGLVRASRDVIAVCEATERCIQRLLVTTSGKLPQQKGLNQAVPTAVLGDVGHLCIFANLSEHMFDCPPDQNHIFILVKCLASCYLKIRMHHLARQFNERVSGPLIRKQLSKLVLFQHQ